MISTCPSTALGTADFPNLAGFGGSRTGFDAICDVLAGRMAAGRATIEGAGHEIQFTGKALDDVVLTEGGAQPM